MDHAVPSATSWSAMVHGAAASHNDKKNLPSNEPSKRKKANVVKTPAAKPATRSMGVQTQLESPPSAASSSPSSYLLPRLATNADERASSLARPSAPSRSSYANVTSTTLSLPLAQTGTIAQRRHQRNMSSLSSIPATAIPERHQAGDEADRLRDRDAFSSPSSRDASSRSSSSFISDKSSAATTIDDSIDPNSGTPEDALPRGVRSIDGLMQDTPRPDSATSKARKKKQPKWVPGMPKPTDQADDAYWSQDPKGKLEAADKNAQRRPSAEVPPSISSSSPFIMQEPLTLPGASVQGLRSVSQPTPFRPIPPFALHIPYGNSPQSPHTMHPILITPHPATPGSAPISPLQPRQMIPVSPQHLMQMLNYQSMGSFQTPDGSPYSPQWGQASTSAQPSPCFPPPQYLRPDQPSVSRQTSHSSLHSSAQSLDQVRLMEQLAALEAKVKAAEVENERKSKELEIAMWRLECIEHEYEKETQEAIRVYAKKAEAAQQRARKLERQVKAAEKKDDDAESRCSSMSDTSASAVGSVSQLDLSSSHGGESVGYSPRAKPFATPSRLDMSILSNGSFGSQSNNFYTSPTGPVPNYFGFQSSYQPQFQSSPRPWRGKKKKKQNSYRASHSAASPTPSRYYNEHHYRQRTDSTARQLNVSGSTATPHGASQDVDSDEDDLVVVLEESRNSITSILGQPDPTPPDVELPIGLGFDLSPALASEEATAVLSPRSDTPKDYVGTLPRFWRSESLRRASTRSDPGPSTDGTYSA